MSKKIAIIGAGLAGLSAGCYARMNGYDADIYEMHNLPGGYCTAWKRKGYTIDGCIHWLTGSAPGSDLYSYYEELGAVQGRRMFDHEVFGTYVGKNGKELVLYSDVDKLEKHLIELSPADASVSRELCGTIRRISKLQMGARKTPELLNWFDKLRMMTGILPYIRTFARIGDKTLKEFAERYEDPFLRSSLSKVFIDENYPIFALVFTLAPMSQKQAGFPLGGSLEFAKAIEKRFLSLGGSVHYGKKVEKVLESSGKATGIRLERGDEVEADIVISASDMKNTLFGLLDGRYIDPLHDELLKKGKLSPSAVMVSFGVDMDLSSDISCIGTSYELDEPVTIVGEKHNSLMLKNFCFDPSLAPKGKSVAGSFIPSRNWEGWKELKKDPEAYRKEKDRIADLCLREFEKRYPGFSEKVEMVDVATPVTFERYTGNWKGTFMTWITDSEFRRKHPYIPKTVPGLEDFYLSSIWTESPGGIPGAVKAGRGVIQLICSKDKKKFVATKPSRDPPS